MRFGFMVGSPRRLVTGSLAPSGPMLGLGSVVLAGCIRFGAFCGSGVESIHGQGVRSELGVLLHGSTESRGGGSRNLLGAFGAREILGGIREGLLGVVGVLGAGEGVDRSFGRRGYSCRRGAQVHPLQSPAMALRCHSSGSTGRHRSRHRDRYRVSTKSAGWLFRAR